jgi:hypothetical protein
MAKVSGFNMEERSAQPIPFCQTAERGTDGPYGARSVKIFLAAILVAAVGFTLVALLSGLQPKEAQQTALAKEPGTILYKVVEIEDGKLIYSFHIKTDNGIHEVNVNLISREIVEDSIEEVMDDEGIILWRDPPLDSPTLSYATAIPFHADLR